MEVFVIAAGVTLVTVVAPIGYTRWRLHRQMRIDPSIPSRAPSWWLVSTVGPAQLHRRLRRAASAARAAGATGDVTLAVMAREAQEHAVALEAPLIIAARLGRAGRAELRTIGEQVTELEVFVARLAVVVRRGHTPPALHRGGAISELQNRLDALEAAHAELAAIEQRAGLQD